MLPECSYLNKMTAEEVASESDGLENLSISRIQCGNKVVMLNQDTNTVFWSVTDKFPIAQDKGISCFINGYPFPFRSVVDPGNMASMNIVKALFMEAVKIMDITLAFFFLRIALSKKRLNFILHSFNRITWKLLSTFILKDEYITAFGSELIKLISTFLIESGVSEEESNKTAIIFSHLLDNDNAYNLRFKDVFSEINLDSMLKNPRKEFLKLMNVVKERDHEGMTAKINKFNFLISMLLLIPRYKKAMIKAFQAIDISKLQSDDNDRYWQAFRTDYKYQGLEKTERMELAKQKGWRIPDSVLK